MVSTTIQTILDNLTSSDNWTLPIGAENLTLSLVNSSFVPKINGFDDGPQFPAYIRTPSMVLCSIILCIGVLGNIMVPCVILKSKDMRNSTNIFLMNLSIADLMVLLVCTPTVLVEVNSKPETWQMGEHMCKAVPFVELTVAHASVLTILAISFERYYAICEPLKAGYVCTKTRAIVICLLAWGFAALFTSPITWITEYKHAQYFDNSIVPVCLTQAEKMWPATYFVLIILVFFILPLILLIVLYAIIAKNLMAEINNTNDNNIYNQRARRQVVTMLALVVLSFFLCLLPFRIITLWIVIIPDDNVYSIKKLTLITYYKVLFISRILLYLNSAINPILYNIMSSKFRKGFKKLVGFKNVNHRKFTYTGTLTTTLNSSNQSSTRRLLMTQKSTPNFYNDDSNSFRNKHLYRQSTDSMLFDRRNKSLQLLKNSGSFQTKSKDFDELLSKTCRQCGITLQEFCKHCRKIVNKTLLDQQAKSKKVCHCQQSDEKMDKNNYLYCKNCEIFVNNRINKAKHSLDASLSTCSRLPINILMQTFESFDSSPVLLKKFNDEKQKEKLRIEKEDIVNDETKAAQQPLLDRSVASTVCTSPRTLALSGNYDNLTDIKEESPNNDVIDIGSSREMDKSEDLMKHNTELSKLTKLECMALEEISTQPMETKIYEIPKIPVSEADIKRDKFSSILKKSNRKLVSKKSNVSFDLENLNKTSSSESLGDKSSKKEIITVGAEENNIKDRNKQEGRFSIRRTSLYDNVENAFHNSKIVEIENTSDGAKLVIPISETKNLHSNSNVENNENKNNTNISRYLSKMSCFDHGRDKADVDQIASHDHHLHSKTVSSNFETGTKDPNFLGQILSGSIESQPINICDTQLPHSNNSMDCDSKDQHFDEIDRKIESSIQLLDRIRAPPCGQISENLAQGPYSCSAPIRDLVHSEKLSEPDTIETVVTTTALSLSLIARMPTLLEELSPVSPIYQNYNPHSFTNVEPSAKFIPSSKVLTNLGAERHQSLGTTSSNSLEPLFTSVDQVESDVVPNHREEAPDRSQKEDYSHCNGHSTAHNLMDLKKCPVKCSKHKFPSTKKPKHKKSYDDIRIEMKRRKSRKRPKLRRENSFDLGDLDLLKVSGGPDILPPFSYSNSETNVKDLITSQPRSSNLGSNTVFINLFDLKDSNEETFV